MSTFQANELRPRTAFGEVLTAEARPVVQVTFPYAINSEQMTSANTATYAAAPSWAAGIATVATTASNGAGTSSLTSTDVCRYGPGQGCDARFTALFSAAATSCSQVIGVGDASDGFFFGYNGTAFGVLRRSSVSGSVVDTWVAQTSWNIDTMNGNGPSKITLDPTKGNVYRIAYQWLGFGAITFYIENPEDGSFIKVHRINYANANTATSIANPTLHFYLAASKTTGTGVVSVSTASLSVYQQGPDHGPYVRQATNNTKTGITTETNVLTIKSKATNVLGGTNTNRVQMVPDFVSVATDGTKTAVVRLVINTTLGGTPSYADISTNTSVAQKETAGTTLTGGKEVMTFQIAKVAQDRIDLSPYNIVLHPGDILTVGVSSSASTDVGVGLSWKEIF